MFSFLHSSLIWNLCNLTFLTGFPDMCISLLNVFCWFISHTFPFSGPQSFHLQVNSLYKDDSSARRGAANLCPYYRHLQNWEILITQNLWWFSNSESLTRKCCIKSINRIVSKTSVIIFSTVDWCAVMGDNLELKYICHMLKSCVWIIQNIITTATPPSSQEHS